MKTLALHQFHQQRAAQFREVNGFEVAAHYGNTPAELSVLRNSVAVVDLSFRSRICLTGGDRQRFLNGQVTNDVKALTPGRGCYACLLDARGRMRSDLNIYCLGGELLLDFEPGQTARVSQRLEQFIIADDVQLVDVAADYGLLALLGPRAPLALERVALGFATPAEPWTFTGAQHPAFGELYCMNHPRGPIPGLDLFVPNSSLEGVAGQLWEAAAAEHGSGAGWEALEIARIESGLPRFGADMDEANLPPEAGLETRAISYTKGCYIGQEVIARVRTYGRVTKTLRGLRLPRHLDALPNRGDRLVAAGKNMGYITSAVYSPTLDANIALGYVRREHNQPGTPLILASDRAEYPVEVVGLPFL